MNRKTAIVAVLTGGSLGVQLIKDKGGAVIAQDRPTSENFSMPETAARNGDVDYILPLDRIASMLIALARSPTARIDSTGPRQHNQVSLENVATP